MARAYVHNYAPREGDLVSGVIKWTHESAIEIDHHLGNTTLSKGNAARLHDQAKAAPHPNEIQASSLIASSIS